MTASHSSTPEPQPAEIAAAVLALDEIVSMSAGPVGQFRSYLPGGDTVPGVRVDDDAVALNVVARWGRLAELGDRVAAALGPLVGDRAVTVTVEDVLVPGRPADS